MRAANCLFALLALIIAATLASPALAQGTHHHHHKAPICQGAPGPGLTLIGTVPAAAPAGGKLDFSNSANSALIAVIGGI